WAGFAAATLVEAARRSRRTLALVCLALAAAALCAVAVLPRERIGGRLDSNGGTGLSRIEVWTSAVHMVADHPVLGIGFDNFIYLYQQRYILPQAWEEPNLSHPHNWLLNVWLNL